MQQQQRPRISGKPMAKTTAFCQKAFLPGFFCSELDGLVPFGLPEGGFDTVISSGCCK